MFKDSIIDSLNYINSLIIGVGQDSSLASTLVGFNAILYGFCNAIMTVMKPVGYSILGLFLMLELSKISIKMEASGGGSTASMKMVFGILIKATLCKLAVDNTSVIMNTIFNMSLHMTQQVSGILSGGAAAGGLNIALLSTVVNNMGMGDQIGAVIQIFIIKILINGVIALVNVIVIGRFVEIYLYIAVSPIPVATIPGEELSSIAKNFFKSFAAVCIQGTLIYIVLGFFPSLMSAAILGSMGGTDINTALFAVMAYCILLALAVFSCGKLAKSICNAM